MHWLWWNNEIFQYKSIHCLRLSFQHEHLFHCKIYNEIFRLMKKKLQKSIWKRFSVLWRDHPYITSELFWSFFTPPIHLISTERQQTGHFQDPPTQSFCWRNIRMVSNELPIFVTFLIEIFALVHEIQFCDLCSNSKSHNDIAISYLIDEQWIWSKFQGWDNKDRNFRLLSL